MPGLSPQPRSGGALATDSIQVSFAPVRGLSRGHLCRPVPCRWRYGGLRSLSHHQPLAGHGVRPRNGIQLLTSRSASRCSVPDVPRRAAERHRSNHRDVQRYASGLYLLPPVNLTKRYHGAFSRTDLHDCAIVCRRVGRLPPTALTDNLDHRRHIMQREVDHFPRQIQP